MTRENTVKILTIVLRIVVGAVFLFSGFVKGIDPSGTVYKIGEYLAFWGQSLPESFLVVASIGLATWEFLLGGLLLLGCFRRLATWSLLATMVIMLPLSAYIAVNNPVSDCGCFGDALVISNNATFWKNLFLTCALIFLVRYNKAVRWFIRPTLQWIGVLILAGYVLTISLYGYLVQPLIDFRRFGVGTVLTAENESDQEPVYEFDYKSPQGEIKTFSIDEIPDDDGWEFIERRVVHGSESQQDGFSILDADGEDLTSQVISPSGTQVLITIPDVYAMNKAYTYIVGEMAQEVEKRGGQLSVLLSPGEEGVNYFQDISLASYPVAAVEPNLLKELVRGNPGLVVLKDGKIVSKVTLASTPVWEELPANNHLLLILSCFMFGGIGILIIVSLVKLMRKHGIKPTVN